MPLIPLGGGGSSANTAKTNQANTYTGSQTVKQGYVYIQRQTEGENSAPELHFDGYRGSWIIGIDVANAPKSRDFVPVALNTSNLVITDAGTTSGSATLTSTAEGQFSSTWVGATITGPGIQAATTILSVQSTTSLTMSKTATATASGVTITFNAGGVTDLIYVKHRGMLTPTFGVALTPPDGSARMQVAASASEPALANMKLLVGAGQTGNALIITDSGNTDRLWIGPDGTFGGNNNTFGSAVAIKGDATNQRPLALAKNDGSTVYSLQYSGSIIQFRYQTGGVTSWQVGTDGRLTSGVAPNFSGTGAQMPHAAGATPSGGFSGEVRVGTGKIWVNDAGTWKSVAVA